MRPKTTITHEIKKKQIWPYWPIPNLRQRQVFSRYLLMIAFAVEILKIVNQGPSTRKASTLSLDLETIFHTKL